MIQSRSRLSHLHAWEIRCQLTRAAVRAKICRLENSILRDFRYRLAARRVSVCWLIGKKISRFISSSKDSIRNDFCLRANNTHHYVEETRGEGKRVSNDVALHQTFAYSKFSGSRFWHSLLWKNFLIHSLAVLTSLWGSMKRSHHIFRSLISP